jgi:hypothetical protein
MSLPGDAEHDRGRLTDEQAFQVMRDFLWQFARRAGDDLITLLGDIEPLEDGQPTDPAAWEDWLESVRRIRSGLPPRTNDGG